MNIQLDFESLYAQALVAWPNVLDLRELQHVAPEFSRYTVKGLGMIFDEIEERTIGKENEIIWRNLHYAIYGVIHETAKNVVKLEATSVRLDAVRLGFERRLRKAVSTPDLNWTVEDISLVNRYFTQQKPGLVP